MSAGARRLIFFGFVFVFIVLAPLLIFWSVGYRPVSLFSWEKAGAVYVYASQPDTSIYFDGEKVHETGFFQRGIYLGDVAPGTHTIVVAKEGYWPWQKNVTATNGLVEEAISFLIPRAPEGTLIFPRTDEQIATTDRPPNNVEYIETLELFAEYATSTEPAFGVMATSSRERVVLAAEEDGLIARWNKEEASEPPRVFCDITPCRDEISVFKGETQVRQADFFPGRENVAIIATGNGIYALDIDTRQPQNFQPIYKGTKPIFVLDGETLYIKDGELLFRIQL